MFAPPHFFPLNLVFWKFFFFQTLSFPVRGSNIYFNVSLRNSFLSFLPLLPILLSVQCILSRNLFAVPLRHYFFFLLRILWFSLFFFDLLFSFSLLFLKFFFFFRFLQRFLYTRNVGCYPFTSVTEGSLLCKD